jgi:hypothetical protein
LHIVNNKPINIGSNVSQRFRMGLVPKPKIIIIINIGRNNSQSTRRGDVGRTLLVQKYANKK